MVTRLFCDKCGGEAVIYRKYSGEKLCKKHFFRSLEKKVYSNLREYLEKGLKVGLAVSGGKDSLTLAYIVTKFVKQRFRDIKLIAFIVDEGIKGYRDNSIRKAKLLLTKLEVPYVVFSFKKHFSITVDEAMEKTNKLNMACTYCGVLRRRALEIMSRNEKIDLLLTGHNACDIAQTIILNVIQGNLKNLSSSDLFPGTVRKEKPLKNILEREIALYASLREIDFCSIPCPYTRYSLRNEIRNFLTRLEENHPGITFSITSVGEKLKQKIKADVKVKKCVFCGFPTTKEVCKACELLKSL